MPNINEFVGPKPTDDQNKNLEKIVGSKPCFKCNLDVKEYYWDPANFTMSWKCAEGHSNTIKVNS